MSDSDAQAQPTMRGRRHLLSARELFEIERSTAAGVTVLQAMVTDRSITAANRQLAKDALAAAERNLAKVRALRARREADVDVR